MKKKQFRSTYSVHVYGFSVLFRHLQPWVRSRERKWSPYDKKICSDPYYTLLVQLKFHINNLENRKSHLHFTETASFQISLIRRRPNRLDVELHKKRDTKNCRQCQA